MTLPTLTVQVDWDNDGVWGETYDNITTDVLDLQYSRGASFDGGNEAPGTCSLTVRNLDGKYSPDNTTGVLGTNLTVNRSVHIAASYGGTAYGIFYGQLRRVTQGLDRTATLYFEDPLTAMARAETHVGYSRTRSIRTFRGAILDDAGVSSAARDLGHGVEDNIPITWADRVTAGEMLDELNRATASYHYIAPQATAGTPFKYTVVDRGALLAGTAVDEAWSEGLVELGSYDLTDELLVNQQRVTPTGLMSTPAATVWTHPTLPLRVAAGATRTIWARFNAPVKDAAWSYAVTGSPTVTETVYSETAKLVITAGVSDAVFSSITVVGEALVETDAESVLVEDVTSWTMFGRRDWWPGRNSQPRRHSARDYGLRVGAEISSPWLSGEADAEGLGSWYVFRYKEPKTRPTFTRQDQFPSMLQRDIGDLVTVTLSLFTMTAKRYWIRSIDASHRPSEGTWKVRYGLEEALPADVWFTLDTAGKGLDDAGAGTEGKLCY